MGSALSNVVTFTVLAPCATPTLTPPPGSYSGAQSVVLACSTPSSSIFYTTDGSAPSPSSTPYTGPISVAASETILCMATAPGFSESASAGGLYTIAAGPPSVIITLDTNQFFQGGHFFNQDTISWNDIGAPAANYRVLRQINGGGFSTLATLPTPDNNTSDSGLQSSWVQGQRDYKIQVLDAGNNVIETTNTVSVLWFNIVSADNSTGPIPAPPGSGPGEGFYDGSTGGGGGSCGSAAPTPPILSGHTLNGACYLGTGGAISDPTGAVALIMTGSVSQGLFSHWKFTDKFSNHYDLAGAGATYSTSLVPGFSIWHWPATNAFPFTNGGTVQMSIN